MSNLSDFLVGKGIEPLAFLDTSGSFNPANYGNPKEIWVEMIGGAGGNAESGTASNGGSTIWDTGAVVATITALGGTGATSGTITATSTSALDGSNNSIHVNFIDFIQEFLGYGCAGSTDTSNTYSGSSGQIKKFKYTLNGTLNFIIGAGGAESTSNDGNGKGGLIKVYKVK
jgi:hypothetical protein